MNSLCTIDRRERKQQQVQAAAFYSSAYQSMRGTGSLVRRQSACGLLG